MAQTLPGALQSIQLYGMDATSAHEHAYGCGMHAMKLHVDSSTLFISSARMPVVRMNMWTLSGGSEPPVCMPYHQSMCLMAALPRVVAHFPHIF